MRTQWGLGTPFPCAGCSTTLVVPKNFWIASSAILAFLLLKSRVDGFWPTVGLLAAILLAILILSRLFVLPREAPVTAPAPPGTPVG